MCLDNEKVFHITSDFFEKIFVLFKELMTKFTTNWSLDQNSSGIKLTEIVALNEFANLIENIVCHIPEKWNRQAFDLIV